MKCIPTFAVMETIDPELDAAKRHLAAYFEAVKSMTRANEDGPSSRSAMTMTYLCSIPRRHDNGAILYVHIFRQDCPGRESGLFTVAASPHWWPVVCQSLQPQRRTEGRAALRLVS